jgi:phage replication-related protein YjqB (UPF0714/DUF867 family)
MSTKECSNPRIDPRALAVRRVRLGQNLLIQISKFGRFCIDLGDGYALDFDGGPVPRLGPSYADPMVALVANVQVRTHQGIQVLADDDQNCAVPNSLAGVHVGDQVRVTRNANEYALYNVVKKRIADNPNRVRMGIGGRMRCGTSDEFQATVRLPVAAPANMTDAQAEAASEFVERLVDDGVNKGLVVIAPHGGIIEFNTDRQAEMVTAALDCSSWICKGWKQGGGGYSRWHITSTKISPRSFPGLGFIANRGFAHAVSFHGMSSGGVLIGGAGTPAVKMLLREAITEAIDDGSIAVTIAQPGDQNSGHSAKNVVNWLTETGLDGIQLEQSPKVRQNHWQAVAAAVISVYSRLL